MVIVDKLSIPERKLLIDVVIKKKTIQEKIKMLIEMEMQLNIDNQQIIDEIIECHNLDINLGYQINKEGELECRQI